MEHWGGQVLGAAICGHWAAVSGRTWNFAVIKIIEAPSRGPHRQQ
jgi:hypothetical protein